MLMNTWVMILAYVGDGYYRINTGIAEEDNVNNAECDYFRMSF